MQLYKNRDFGEVLSDYFSFLGQHYKVILGYVFKFLILPLLIFSILGGLLGVSVLDLDVLNIGSAAPAFGVIAFIGLAVFVFVLLLIYVNARIYGYMKGYADSDGDAEEAEAYSAQEGMSIAIRLLVFVFVFGLVGGLMFALFSGVAFGAGAAGGSGVIAMLFGVLFFLVFPLLVFLSIKISFATYAFSVGDDDLIGAFKRSWDLTSGYWWYTAGVILVVGMISSILSNIITLPLIGLGGLTGYLATSDDSGMMAMLLGLAAGLVIFGLTFALYYLTVPASIVTYYSLSEKKYGVRLAKGLDDIGRPEEDSLFENEGEY